MARARRAAASNQAGATSSGQAQVTFTCPECGKAFTRAASLGAHRQRAHGVAGAKKRRTVPARTGTRSAVSKGGPRRPARVATGGGQARNGGVNRDRLLQAIFPNGLPAREEIIRRANAWLDEAEQLAASK